MYFHYFVIISLALYLNKIPLSNDFCAKFDGNWPIGTGEEDS